MNTATRLVAFAAGLALVFGGAALAGAATAPTARIAGHGTAGGHGTAPGSGHDHLAAGMPLSGLALSADGYTLRPGQMRLTAAQSQRFDFQVLDAQGQAVRDAYEVESEKRMHLIVVRRDTADYQHLHPSMATDGTWSVDLRPELAGVYRAYADFQVSGQKHVLATDLFVPGDFTPQPFPVPARSATTDGYDVELGGDLPAAGLLATLVFAVRRGDRPVTELENYLGARGHLVALREGDLAYLHAHPEQVHAHPGMDSGMDMATNTVTFAATFPTAGRYRLFLQFQTDGEIHTAAYTLEVAR